MGEGEGGGRVSSVCMIDIACCLSTESLFLRRWRRKGREWRAEWWAKRNEALTIPFLEFRCSTTEKGRKGGGRKDSDSLKHDLS